MKTSFWMVVLISTTLVARAHAQDAGSPMAPDAASATSEPPAAAAPAAPPPPASREPAATSPSPAPSDEPPAQPQPAAQSLAPQAAPSAERAAAGSEAGGLAPASAPSLPGVSRRIAPAPHRPLAAEQEDGHAARGAAKARCILALGASLVWTGDRGYERVGERARRDQLELFAAYDVLASPSGSALALGASYRADAADGHGLSVSSHTVQGELMARYGVAAVLAPYLRIAGGVTTSALAADDEELAVHGRDNSATGTLGAGLLIQTPPGEFETGRGRLRTLSFGALFEGGYVWSGPATFAGRSVQQGEVARHGVSLASLALGGGYLRLMGGIRF